MSVEKIKIQALKWRACYSVWVSFQMGSNPFLAKPLVEFRLYEFCLFVFSFIYFKQEWTKNVNTIQNQHKMQSTLDQCEFLLVDSLTLSHPFTLC